MIASQDRVWWLPALTPKSTIFGSLCNVSFQQSLVEKVHERDIQALTETYNAQETISWPPMSLPRQTDSSLTEQE